MKKLFLILTSLFLVLFTYGQRPEMVLVKGGTFYMGNVSSGHMDEKPLHKVVLSDFYIGKYEVTFDEFDLFCKATGYRRPSDGGYGRGKLPVMNVSWEGAIKYCNWLSTRFGLDKVYELSFDSTGMVIKNVNWNSNGFRLPTEAEWEYAAKGGNKGNIYKIEEMAWYAGNSDGRPHEVGTKKPNGLEIYDMLGNAWEWCWDWYAKDYYSKSPERDPKGPETGTKRVYRGGNFNSDIDNLNVTRRYSLSPKVSSGAIGIRLAQSAVK